MRAEFPLSWSDLSVLGITGTVPVRLLEPSRSCVKLLNDDIEVGIVPVNDVDVRSSVCNDEASEEELAMVDSGDGDKDCELTSRLCSFVSLVTLLGRDMPICELRTKTKLETFTNPGYKNSASGRAVIAVDSRWRDVIAVRLVKDVGRDPAGTVFPPTT